MRSKNAGRGKHHRAARKTRQPRRARNDHLSLRTWRLGGKISPEIISRKGAKGAKFGEIEVGASKKVDGAEWGLSELSVLAGKEFRRSVSRKGAKGAKVRSVNLADSYGSMRSQ